MPKGIKLLLALILLTMFVSTGCGKKDGDQNTGASTEAAAKTLTIRSQNDIGTLNPHNYNSQMFAQDFIYENLLKYGPGGKIEPWLAESWEISPDGKIYTFQLRKGVKFSDGSEFNSQIVQKNYEAVLKVKANHNWLEMVNQIAKTEAPNPYTFKIHFKNPYYPALQELTLIRPLRFLGAAGFPDKGDPSAEVKQPIGTGPWVLAEYKENEYAVFVPNQYYWGEKPKVSKLVVKVIPDGETAVAALEKGEINMIFGGDSLSLDTFNNLKESGKFQTKVSEPMLTRVIGLNTNKGPTKELPVRMALQMGADKAAIINNVFYGTEAKADTLFAKNFPYCDLNLPPRNYDPAKAEKLLDEAGWKLPAGKTYREKHGQVLELDLNFIGGNSVDKSISEILQAEYKKLGIKINLVGEEKQSFNDRSKRGDFELIFGETWGAPYDPHSLVSSMRTPSHFDYEAQRGLPMKKTLDAKIAQVLVSTNAQERQELYSYILGTLHDQAVYLPISYTTNKAVFSSNITGVKFATFNEIPLTEVEIK